MSSQQPCFVLSLEQHETGRHTANVTASHIALVRASPQHAGLTEVRTNPALHHGQQACARYLTPETVESVMERAMVSGTPLARLPEQGSSQPMGINPRALQAMSNNGRNPLVTFINIDHGFVPGVDGAPQSLYTTATPYEISTLMAKAHAPVSMPQPDMVRDLIGPTSPFTQQLAAAPALQHAHAFELMAFRTQPAIDPLDPQRHVPTFTFVPASHIASILPDERHAQLTLVSTLPDLSGAQSKGVQFITNETPSSVSQRLNRLGAPLELLHYRTGTAFAVNPLAVSDAYYPQPREPQLAQIQVRDANFAGATAPSMPPCRPKPWPAS